MKPCVVPGCPELVAKGARCRSHGRGTTTTERGYGVEHQKRRALLLPAAIGTACPLCFEAMLADQALDLDHSVALVDDASSLGDRIVHARCNRSAGARLAATGVGPARVAPPPDPARHLAVCTGFGAFSRPGSTGLRDAR